MSDYPEHDKLKAVAAETQAAGEFLEWLQSQGVQLMIWREDLTDTRPTDPRCADRRDDAPAHKPGCKPVSPADGYEVDGLAYWLQHCTHWTDAEGDCCRCGKGQFYEVTGIHGWTPERRSIAGLLADWSEIDQSKIEAEKRAMLAGLREVLDPR